MVNFFIVNFYCIVMMFEYKVNIILVYILNKVGLKLSPCFTPFLSKIGSEIILFDLIHK